jgi:phospholipase C
VTTLISGSRGKLGTVSDVTDAQARVLDQAAAAGGGPASLNDIEHVIILIQENRSFDHYFGTMSGVRGFSDPAALPGVFAQVDPRGSGGFLQPFRLWSDPPGRDGQSLNDISHTWPTQHLSWNHGKLDEFVSSHLAANGPEDGPVTMGYYTRADLPFYYALADAFTVCDGYFCSVLGPTDSNRVMAMSGTIDPAGQAGGPVLQTYVERVTHYGSLRWETMPDRLQAAGVSWKVYSARLAELALSPLPYFRQFAEPFSIHGAELVAHGLTPDFPDDFMDDVRRGSLPSVSWIIPPLSQCEHPAAPPAWGEHLIHSILSALVARPDVWERTVLFVVHDENGGFFDHVPPPVAPAGTPGEWIVPGAAGLPAAAGGISGPVGLGFRTACLVISPYSRGGYVCSDVFDHTSLLRFIERRFGAEVPNLSGWRRSVTGDLVSALSLGAGSPGPDPTVPTLPQTSIGAAASVIEQSVLNALAGSVDRGIPYPLPAANEMPVQETAPARRRRG